MTIPSIYSQRHLPVKYFLSSYRAYSDGKSAVEKLRNEFSDKDSHFTDWKIHWVAALTLLRASIEMFKVDKKICVNDGLANSFAKEWDLIGSKREEHEIYWLFLREERNNILHEYKWSAYKRYLDDEGNALPPNAGLVSLFLMADTKELLIRSGHYKGENALNLIEQAADWVEQRIVSAIQRAGFEPDESRNLVTFELAPKTQSLLSQR